MPRPEQFVISAMPDIEVAQDGHRCLIHMTNLDGKRIDLALSPEEVPDLANTILSAASNALTSADGRERLAVHSCGASASRLAWAPPYPAGAADRCC